MFRGLDAVDRRPGVMPEIHAERDAITFVIPVHGDKRIANGVRLVLRCDLDGNVWGAIKCVEPEASSR